MMEIVKNILKVKKGLICHQVNCKGIMGGGLALSIKKKWSHVYNLYMQSHKDGKLKLGFTQIISVNRNGVNVHDWLYVANMCGQNMYGRGYRYTDYDALRTCFKGVADLDYIYPIYVPYKMGCGLAGGDWNIVKKIIEEEIPSAIICRLEE